jgi:hypothetical protein
VKVAAHQHPRMNHPNVAFTKLPEMMKEGPAVIVGHKHHIPPISPGASRLSPRSCAKQNDPMRRDTGNGFAEPWGMDDSSVRVQLAECEVV